MTARRLAVALPPTNPRLLPPPPPAPSIGDGRRPSPSLASMLSGDFIHRPRYRCCCRLMHLKTASFLIGVVDTLGMSAAFGRGLHLGLNIRHNPMAVSWLVISTLMFSFSFVCTLAMFYGVWKENYLWVVPKLVMKISGVVLYSASTVGLVYMMMEHSQYLLDLVAEHVMKSDYEAARLALRTGGGGLAVAFLLMALVHVWWFYVLYRCYKYLKDRYFWKRTRSMHAESNENHVAAILAAANAGAGPHYSGALTATGASDDPSRSRLSTMDDVNSSAAFGSPRPPAVSGRNGAVVRRSVSQEGDTQGGGGRIVDRMTSAANSTNTLVSDFGSLHMMQEIPSSGSVRIRSEDSVAVCSCYSPTMPPPPAYREASRDGFWTGMNQTHV